VNTLATPASVTRALAGANPAPYWLDHSDRPPQRQALKVATSADLAIVGAGFTGLWTALLAKQANPDRDVLLVEAGRVGWAASGRNGGFCSASLTHGPGNGRDRFADELETLDRLGRDNLAGLVADVGRLGIDCHLEPTGELGIATEAHQVEWLQEEAALGNGDFLDAARVRAEVDSPTYLAGLWERDTTVLVDPARLAWGLARAAEEAGVRIVEGTHVRGLERDGAQLRLSTRDADVVARQVALGTSAFPSLLRRVRPYVMPVYDYALVTEPLTDDQLGSIGWRNRQGIGDSANQFHYYRLTADNRILFGGYDAIYPFGKRIRPERDQRQQTFRLLADHLFTTFPQLDGIACTHAWGGVIDLCSRFCAFYGTAYDGRVAHATGYTGLGVGATRFGAQVMLDLLGGEETERTATRMVRSKPMPFPPEPFAYAGIELTRRSLAAADRHQGRRNLWLRTLDRLGLGFDS